MQYKRRSSIRWKLPISYAAIAFLAALALGIILLSVLRGYYAALERQRAQSNAQALRSFVAYVLTNNPEPVENLNNHFQSIAFLWDTRITLLDNNGSTVIDTGVPNSVVITLDVQPANPETASYPNDYLIAEPDQVALPTLKDFTASPNNSVDLLPIQVSASLQISTRPDNPIGDDGTGRPMHRPDQFQFIPIIGSPFGIYGVPREQVRITTDSLQRSDQMAEVTLYGQNADALGTLRLYDGPAYGIQIVESVAHTWLIASSIAIIIAGGVGWAISRRLSEPLVALTLATQRMAQGDLTVRTEIQRHDELGILSSTFDDMACRIEKTVNTLRLFVADAAHELHTPLTALKTNIELALEAECSGGHTLKRALEQLERLEALADDLLDLSRLESQTQIGSAQPVQITPLVQQISEVYASRAEQADLDYMLYLPEQSAPVIFGNPTQLQRLLANLLDNSIKFTPSGGQIAVTVNTTETALELIVEDTGIGIPAEDLPYLFERFRRGRNTAQYPGSGLGLAIVRAIATAHQGSVKAERCVQGTKISVLLPLPNAASRQEFATY